MRTRVIRLAIVFVLLCPLATAQWFTQNSGTTKNLYGVSFTDANTGTAVGDSGTILRTTDGGTTWTSQASGTTLGLTGVSCTDANTGTAVGGGSNGDIGAIILRTTDGGATWAPQSSGTTIPLHGVCFTDVSNGTVVGGGGGGEYPLGIILHTTNGGATWVKQFETDSTSVNSVSFSDRNTGTAVGGGWTDVVGWWTTILRTTDGGTTWITQTEPQSDILRSVVFTDANTGTAVGGAYGSGDIPYSSYVILRTTDGGVMWTTQKNVTRAGNGFNCVFFTDANTGTAVGHLGYCSNWSRRDNILRTTDGGSTWEPQASGTSNPLRGVCFTDVNTGTAVGDSGTILRTTNGGVTSVEGEQQYGVSQRYVLNQNYPNPFNPSTTIGYELLRASHVSLSVCDILGREVITLLNEDKSAGTYTVQWDASGVSSGVYVYRLKAGDFVQTKRLMVLK
jgi:photosystem II stability/assembly factor-like uncharacterized protein